MASQLRVSWGLGGGIAIRPFRGLTLAADYTRSEWSRTTIANVPNGALLTPEQRDTEGELARGLHRPQLLRPAAGAGDLDPQHQPVARGR